MIFAKYRGFPSKRLKLSSHAPPRPLSAQQKLPLKVEICGEKRYDKHISHLKSVSQFIVTRGLCTIMSTPAQLYIRRETCKVHETPRMRHLTHTAHCGRQYADRGHLPHKSAPRHLFALRQISRVGIYKVGSGYEYDKQKIQRFCIRRPFQ